MRKTALILACVLCAGNFVPQARGGEVHGRIVISRTLTKKRVTVPNYQMRGPALAPPLPEPALTAEYSKIAIYLEGTFPTPPTPTTASLTQKNQKFEPAIMVIPVGSTVSFPNGDPIFHNVFSLSSARKFDLGYYPAGETRRLKFDKPGIVQVYCHLHSDMNAAIIVTPSEWYTLPDPKGNFSFASLPPGQYQVVVWHKSAGFFRRQVEVTEQGTVDLSIEIPIQEIPSR